MPVLLEQCGRWGDSGAPAAQVKTIWYVSILSFCWSCVRWLFSRTDVPYCGGFELMPTFGRAALRQVWRPALYLVLYPAASKRLLSPVLHYMRAEGCVLTGSHVRADDEFRLADQLRGCGCAPHTAFRA